MTRRELARTLRQEASEWVGSMGQLLENLACRLEGEADYYGEPYLKGLTEDAEGDCL
jgi:hypothetical protein